MRIKFRNHNYIRILILAECVWQGFSTGVFITPCIRFDILNNGWTFDVIWLKLWITFGYVKYGINGLKE